MKLLPRLARPVSVPRLALPVAVPLVALWNFAFSPQVIHAKVGQTIVWTNKDSPAHNVTYVSGPKFTSSSNFGTGATYSVKVTQAGSITYFCSIHPFMKHGTIVVTR